MLQPGDSAPAIRLPLLAADGAGPECDVLDLAGGRAVLTVFFRISCPVCQYAFPFLERLSKGALPVVAVSQDDAAGTREFHSELGVTIPTLLDQRGSYPASRAYRITNVPSMFLLDPVAGKVLRSETGFLKQLFEELGAQAGVQPFLPGEKVPNYRPG